MKRHNHSLFFLWLTVAALFASGCSQDESYTQDSEVELRLVYEAVDTLRLDSADEAAAFAPFRNAQGEAFQVAVYQSGDYFSYADVFEGIIRGLMALGWITEFPLVYTDYPEGKSVANIIALVAKGDDLGYLRFGDDLFFDLKWSDDRSLDPEFKKIMNQADLVISLGTQVSTILSGMELQVPVLVDSISDPVGSGILRSIEDSGQENLTGLIDPKQDYRQIELFHSVIQFETLGILYEDTDIGRAYGSLDSVTLAARELGFEIKASTDVLPDPEDDDDDAAWEAAEDQYVRALAELAPEVDAVYLAAQAGLSEYSLERIVEVLTESNTPSFIQEGKGFVQAGILLGESDANLLSIGLFDGRKIIQILKGASPRSLSQVFEHVPHIAINLDTAEKIGFDVPIDILASADVIYRDGRASRTDTGEALP